MIRAASLCLILLVSQALAAAPQAQIPPQSLADALTALARQSGLQLIYGSDAVKGRQTKGAPAGLTASEVLARVLEGTGLEYEFLNDHTVTIWVKGQQKPPMRRGDAGDAASALRSAGAQPQWRLARVDPAPDDRTRPQPQTREDEAGAGGIPEILVKGQRTINSDIRRTEDDTQPYVVFDRRQIERSMAANLEDFLKTRLPMNTVQGTNAQRTAAFNFNGNQSTINLRGLGTNQTVILVDGRRLAGVNTGGGDFGQPDVNGIPLSSIERIEILPSTASGIYGGSATGGVVNIITRKDYAGIDVNLSYDNSFGSDAASRRVDASAGFNLEEGRTQLLLSGSYSDANPLLSGERDFSARGRALQRRNNPNTFVTPTVPVFGYTPNIRSQNGQPLQLKPQYGGQLFTTARTSIPEGYAGVLTGGGAPLLANDGSYNLDLPDDMNSRRQSLLNNPTIRSATLSLRRSFGERVEAFIDANRLENDGRYYIASVPSTVTLPSTAANNPFINTIVVRFPATGLSLPLESRSNSVRATGGLIVRLPRNWTASADYLWSRSKLDATAYIPGLGDPDGAGPGISVTTALSTGVLDVMRDLNRYPLDFSPYVMPAPTDHFGPADVGLKQTSLRLSGPVFQLPAGPVMLSALAERRDANTEDAFEDTIDSTTALTSYYIPGATQKVDAYYLEARVPVFSAANGFRFMRSLELQGSLRRDNYRTRSPDPSFIDIPSRSGPFPDLAYSANEFNDLSYTIGLRYSPAGDLTLRASLGTGFLPPGLNQITATSFPASQAVVDPRRGGVLALTEVIPVAVGGNPGLSPENSRSWSAGAILTPGVLPGLRVSIDYTRITKTNEIAEPSAQLLLDLENLFPGRVVRGTLSAGDAALGYTGGEILGLDLTAANFASTRLEAWDMQADYGWETATAGRFDLFTILTWQPHFERQALPDEPFIDSVGFNFGQLEWRGNAGLTWERNAWTAGWSAQFYDSHHVYSATASLAAINTARLSQGADRIPSQLYHDLFVRYRFAGRAGFAGRLLANGELALGIQNVLDRSPPIIATTAIVGGYSTYGDPRMRRYSVGFRKSFGGS